jgi:hypothetical protein
MIITMMVVMKIMIVMMDVGGGGSNYDDNDDDDNDNDSGDGECRLIPGVLWILFLRVTNMTLKNKIQHHTQISNLLIFCSFPKKHDCVVFG